MAYFRAKDDIPKQNRRCYPQPSATNANTPFPHPTPKLPHSFPANSGNPKPACENSGADVGDNGVDRGARCETVDEEPDGHEKSTGENERDAEFWSAWGVVVAF